MADVASLSFAIDSAPIDRANASLDQLSKTADTAGGGASRLLSATDALVQALNRNTAAADQLRTTMAGINTATMAARTSLSSLGQAANDAATGVTKVSTSTKGAKSDLDAITAAANRAAAAWRDLGSAGAATSKLVRPYEQLGALSGNGSVPQRGPANQNVPGGREGALQGYQLQNLGYQAGDIIAQLGSGSALSTIAMQQGPQIAQVFGGTGATIKGALGQAADAATAMAQKVGLVTGALGAAAVAFGTIAAAVSSFTSQQKELQLAVAGRGRASGASVGDINRIAGASAGAAGLSVSNSRDLIADYTKTGQIGQEMYAGLLKSARDYAETTGQDVPDANKALAAAFADPVQGAERLNAQLGFLDANLQENIKNLAASGDRLGAQKMLLDGMSGSLVSATSRLGFFAAQWEAFKNTTSNEFDAIGRVVDRVISGGDLETQLETARKVLQNAKGRQGWLPLFGDSDVAKAQADVDRLSQQVDQRQRVSQRTADAARSMEINRLVQGANPAQEQLKQLDNGAANIRRYFAENWLDPSGEAGNTMRGMETAARRIREDLANGGSDLAAGLRRATFDASQVGRSSTSQTAAGIDNDALEKQRAIESQNLEPNARNAQLQAIEMARVTQQQTLQRQTVINSSSGGGSYAIGLGQVPSQYRDLYYNAANQYGINPDLLASQAKRESSFNPRALSPAGAQGIAQFMPGTRDALGGFDAYDPSQAIPKQAELMRQLLDRYNGNEAAALVGYNAGPRRADKFVASGFDTSVLPRETQEYLKAILTPAPGAQQAVMAQVERNRALDDENDKVKTNAQYLGENGRQLDVQTRYQQLLSDAMSRNVNITDEYRASLMKTAEGMADASRALTNVRAASELKFDNAQLGRDRYDQQAYSSARSLYGDTSSAEAQNYIGQRRSQLETADARSTMTDATTGFVQALSKGTDAASAFSSAMSKISDKLISGAIDSIMGNLFKQGGGSFFSGLGSLFGGGGAPGAGGNALSSIGSLFGFANGGIMGPGGPVQLRTYARGGVATGPQLALFGEGSHNEAYVPLPDGKRIPVAMSGPANSNGGVGGGNVTVINNGDPMQQTVQRKEDGSTTIILDRFEARTASRISRGQGPLSAALPTARQMRG